MFQSAIRPAALAFLAALALVAAWVPGSQAQPLQPGFTESVVLSGLTDPTDVAFAPDGRVFVAEKSGLIKAFSGLNTTTSTIAVDLRTQVHNFWDRGLLGLAIDPQFPIRPYLYALYTYDGKIGETAPRWGQPGVSSDPCPTPPGPTDAGCVVSTRLAKLTLSGSVVTNQQTLIHDWCQQFPSHSAGGLVFGPDGMLYVSGGDGASFLFTDYGQEGNPCGDPPGAVGTDLTAPTAEGGALRSQDYRTTADPTGLDGTLIRVDPDTGAAAPGNPMSASSDANARRIVAAGMRNPFRFAFRPGTNEIYVGDVGWGAWEEINRLPAPTDTTVDNFGWPCYEGNGQSPAYAGAGLNLCKSLYSVTGAATSPLYTYSHSGDVVAGEDCTEAGASVSGLAFYQGGSYPAAYTGALFFADYSKRCTWVMFEKNGQIDPSTRAVFLNENDPVNLEIGPNGDLFLVDFNGSLRRIHYPGGNRAPTAVAKAEPQAGPLPLTVNFDGSGSTDPDAGDVLSYAWDLDGDGQYDDSTAVKPSWTYTSAANVTVRLKVTDKGGLVSTASLLIGAGNELPQAQIDTPTTALRWSVGDTIAFSGKGSDPQDGTLGGASMSWTLVMRHCETENDCHSHTIQTFPGVASGSFTAPDHEFPSHLELRLTVTDSGGLSDTETLRLDPETVDLTFKSDPAGLNLTTGEQSGPAPYVRTVIVGSKLSVAAPSPQSLNGTVYGFSSWSDGGANSHEVIAPATATTYTATYKPEPSPPGLVLGYGFEETAGTTASDVSPFKNTGTISGATGTASGKFGRALSFDGSNDRVDVPDAASLDLTTGMTLEAWVKPTTNSGWRTVILKERGTNDLLYALYSSNGAKPRTENFTGVENTAAGTTALPLNAWSHLAATYDGTNLRFYVNAALIATKTTSGAMPNTANPLRIGGNAVWGEYFSGLIDEVRVYNRALSASEIDFDMKNAVGSSNPPPADTTPPSAPGNLKAVGAIGKVSLSWEASTDNVGVTGYEVYRSTAAGFTPGTGNRIATPTGTSYTDNVAPGTYYYRVKATDAATNLSAASNEAVGASLADAPPSVTLTAPTSGATVSGTVPLKATAGDDVGVAGVTFLVDGAPVGSEDTSSPYEVSWASTGVANGTHKIAARARDAANQTTTSTEVTVTVSNSAPPATGLVLAFGFEETAGTTANDSSTAKNNGTISGATSTASGKYGRALSFDGSNDRVDVPDASTLDLTTGMTLEAWVKPTTNVGWRTVILKERGSDLLYALYSSNGSKPRTESFTGVENTAAGTTALPLNAWSHLAATYDGTNLRFYLNGTLITTKVTSGAMPNTANPLRIGGNAVWGEYFSGLIDEVRIYNRALNETELKADMNAKVVP